MRHFLVPTAVSGINFVVSFVCMCSAAAGTVGAAVVFMLQDIHCSLAVEAANSDVVGVVATDAGAATVSISVVAGPVAAGVATWVLSDAVLSKTLVCPVQTWPSPSVL